MRRFQIEDTYKGRYFAMLWTRILATLLVCGLFAAIGLPFEAPKAVIFLGLLSICELFVVGLTTVDEWKRSWGYILVNGVLLAFFTGVTCIILHQLGKSVDVVYWSYIVVFMTVVLKLRSILFAEEIDANPTF